MSRAIMAYYISLVPAGVCPGTGFCPLPFPVRGAEVGTEVGNESAERSLIGLESVVHPGDLSSKKGLLPSFQDLKTLLLGYLPLSPCGGGSREGTGLSPMWALGFLSAFSFPALSIKQVMGLLCQGQSDIRVLISEVWERGTKLWGWPALLVGGERPRIIAIYLFFSPKAASSSS